MKKLKFILTAIGVSLLLTAPVFAWGPPAERGMGYGQNQPDNRECAFRGFNKISLSEEQKTKIDALCLAHLKDIRPLREKMFDRSVELRRLWLEPNPDKNKIYAKQKEVRALRDQLEDKRTAYRLEINKLLTPEQKEKLAAYGWDRGTGFGPRGGKRDRGASGPGVCF